MKQAIWLLAFGMVAKTAPVDLDGLAHVAYHVTDVAVSREFYDKLGFEQAFEFNDDKGTTTSYVKVNDRQFIELYRRPENAPALGLMHLCFDTSAIEPLRAEYEGRGLKPTENRKARAGNLLFNLKGPEGELLEYTQYMPGSLHSNERGKHLSGRRISDHIVLSSTPVNDLAVERTYFREKLGFSDLGGSTTSTLQIPGQSGEMVELDPATTGWKAKLVFAVSDVQAVAVELRRRGLTPAVSTTSVKVLDPDGTVLVFEASKH